MSFADTVKPHTAVITAEKQQGKTSQQALQRLKDGNKRFMSGKMKNRNLITQAHLSATAQHPVAVILSCMDARTPPQKLFLIKVLAMFLQSVMQATFRIMTYWAVWSSARISQGTSSFSLQLDTSVALA